MYTEPRNRENRSVMCCLMNEKNRKCNEKN